MRAAALVPLLAAFVALAAIAAAQAPYAFEEADWGLGFVHAHGLAEEPAYPEVMGGGACVIDYDGDGWEDLFLGNGRFWNRTLQERNDLRSQLYRNLEGHGFDLVTGALDMSAWVMGCAVGDYDADRDPDIAINTWRGLLLYRNDGNGSFTNVTADAGVERVFCGAYECFGGSVAWLDYDLDGDLDLYATNYVNWDRVGPASPTWYEGQCNFLYRNDGGGAFTDVSEASNTDDCGRNHLGLAIADVNRDGWPDIFVASDMTENAFLVNNGDGTFTDETQSRGLSDLRAGMGTAWGDYDGDGLYDLVITHYAGEHYALYRQNADGTFTDRAVEDGLNVTYAYVGWGADFVDLDNDEDQDLVIVNGHSDMYYANGSQQGYAQEDFVLTNEGGTFRNATSTLWHPGPVENVSRGLAFADFDQDGFLDLVNVNNANETARVWRGTGGPNNWISFRLAGNGAVNPDAVHALVTIEHAGGTVTRELMAQASYFSQSTRDVRFGLGASTRVDRVTVAWPDGTEQAFTDVDANALLALRAGGALTEVRARPLAAVAEARVDALRMHDVTLSGTPVRAPGGAAQESWTVDGVTHAGGQVTLTFDTLGEWDAVYRVTDSTGHVDEAVTRIVVRNAPPVPEALLPATADRLTSVTLDGTGSSDADGRVVNWTWDVEGTQLHGSRVTYTFATAGSIPVTLTVRDNDGATANVTHVVDVANLVPVANAGPDLTGNQWSTFTFDARESNDPDGDRLAFEWAFPDGSTATGAVVHKAFEEHGTFTVGLTVTDAYGAVDTDDVVITIVHANAPPVPRPGPDRVGNRLDAVSFDATASYDPDGTVAAYHWDFGGGATATDPTASHLFDALGEFTVTLTVTDDNGTSASANVTVTIRNLAPAVDAGPDVRHEGFSPVTLEATGTDRDGSIEAWAWDFDDDGATAEGRIVTHQFDRYGTFLVRATGTDNEGASASDTRQVWIYAKPYVHFRHGDRVTDRLTSVAFDASGSFDPDGHLVGWEWDFGDGATATGESRRTHRYGTLGTHAMHLTLQDADGFRSTGVVNVTVVNLPPHAAVTGPTAGNVNQTLVFGPATSRDPDGSLARWEWDFGDGTRAVCDASGCRGHGLARASTVGGVAHAYAVAGTYTVRLTVVDSDGARAHAETTVRVEDALSVHVRMDRDAFSPTETPAGEVVVTLADGTPVANARVRVTITYLVGEPSARVALTIVDEREAWRAVVDVTTDATGRARFEVPPASPDALVPWGLWAHGPTAADHAPVPVTWGRHHVAAHSTAYGNSGAGETEYAVKPDAVETPPVASSRPWRWSP